MKLKDLLTEMPIFLPPSGNDTIFNDLGSYISKKTYSRSYTKIGTFPVTIGTAKSVDILMSKSGKSVVGVVPATRPIDKDVGYKDVFFLMFKDQLPNSLPPELNHDKVVQVDGVETTKELQGRGLSVFVYFLLINMGYTIVSDFFHEYGGLKLWRKLAKLSNHNDFIINIMDNGSYVLDDQGQPLKFTGDNFPKVKSGVPLQTIKIKKYYSL
jgi:hypothetical protein